MPSTDDARQDTGTTTAQPDAVLTGAQSPSVSTPERERAAAIRSIVWKAEEAGDFSRRSRDVKAGFAALVEAGREDPELLAAALTEGQFSGTPDVRDSCKRSVLKALAEIADERTVPYIVSAAQNEYLWTATREEAVKTLGAMKLDAAIEPLKSFLMDDQMSMAFRVAAAHALVPFGAKSLEILYGVLAPDEEGRSRNYALAAQTIIAIGNIREASSAAVLSELLIRRDQRGIPEYESVRTAVGHALGEIGEASVQPLIKCLQAAEIDTIYLIRCAFDQVGPVATPALVELYKSDQQLSEWIDEILKDIGGPEAYLALLDIHRNENPMHLDEIRLEARGVPEGMKKAMVGVLEEIRDFRRMGFYDSQGDSQNLEEAMICYEAIKAAADARNAAMAAPDARCS